jgi:DNA-directed RNA polymerase specialized sigma24 family protein
MAPPNVATKPQTGQVKLCPSDSIITYPPQYRSSGYQVEEVLVMVPDEDGSVSQWITALRDGDEEAAARLWERFMCRLRGLVRTTIAGAAYDEEDVALSAFDALCRGLADGRYPELTDRGQLWQLLATIARRKARDRFDAEKCQKRGGRQIVQAEWTDLDHLPGREGDPEFEALMADQCRRLLDLLQNARLEQVVLWKLDGYTNEEIAGMLDMTRWSVGRMLNCVRKIWETQL